MFSFFQTIFHKVTAVIATAAIAIGFISAPEPPKQQVLDNQSPVVVERQIKTPESQIQKEQSKVNISVETEKLKKEIESLKKDIGQKNQPLVVVNQPTQQPQQPQVQKTVPPRPENSDEWTFNWNTWAWEKHPSVPPVAPTIIIPTNQQASINQQTTQQATQQTQINTQTQSTPTQIQPTPMPKAPKILLFEALEDGFAYKIQWDAENNNKCKVTSLKDNSVTTKNPEDVTPSDGGANSGTVRVVPRYTETYTLTCFNDGGKVQSQITIEPRLVTLSQDNISTTLENLISSVTANGSVGYKNIAKLIIHSPKYSWWNINVIRISTETTNNFNFISSLKVFDCYPGVNDISTCEPQKPPKYISPNALVEYELYNNVLKGWNRDPNDVVLVIGVQFPQCVVSIDRTPGYYNQCQSAPNPFEFRLKIKEIVFSDPYSNNAFTYKVDKYIPITIFQQ